jgi:hypothetical protein
MRINEAKGSPERQKKKSENTNGKFIDASSADDNK